MNVNDFNLFDFLSRLFAAALFYTWGIVKLMLYPRPTAQRYLAGPTLIVALTYGFLAFGDVLHIFPTQNLNQFVRFSLYPLVIFSILVEAHEARRVKAYADLVRLSSSWRANPDLPINGTQLLEIFKRLGYYREGGTGGGGGLAGNYDPAGVGTQAGWEPLQSIRDRLQRGHSTRPPTGGATRPPDSRP